MNPEASSFAHKIFALKFNALASHAHSVFVHHLKEEKRNTSVIKQSDNGGK